ncbi:MAG: hypothetical protein ACEQSN_18575 [Yersinia sp. (in: enterobacteria)]
MTDLTVSIDEDAVMSTLGDLITIYVSCPVVQGQINRVPMPDGDLVMMTQLSAVPLSTNINNYGSTTKTLMRPTQFTVQLDFYGENSMARSSSISAILRDEVGTDFFTASGYDMQTLYASDAKQMPLVTGEEQYMARWTLSAVLQINQVITLPVETANTLTVDIINVDATFPPL